MIFNYNDYLKDQLKVIINKYPQLSFYEDTYPYGLIGKIEIVDENLVKWGEFEILILIPDDYPNSYPKVYELSGQIPKEPDWHVFTDSGSCCVGVYALIQKTIGVNYSFVDYFDKIAMPHFANCIHKKKYNVFKNGEASHNEFGVIEFYKSELGIIDNKFLYKILKEYLKTRYNRIPIFSHFKSIGYDEKQIGRLMRLENLSFNRIEVDFEFITQKLNNNS